MDSCVYVETRQERPKGATTVATLDVCIANYESCMRQIQAWYVKYSQEFLWVGAEQVYNTLKSYAEVPNGANGL